MNYRRNRHFKLMLTFGLNMGALRLLAFFLASFGVFA